MTKRISIICAVQPKPNPGMSSVDLAFYVFAKRNFPDAKLSFLKICDEEKLHEKRSEEEKTEIRQRSQLPFKYESFLNNLNELYNSDLIVYWGDFFHMAHYRESEASRQMEVGVVDTCDQALDLVDKHFFLTEAPPEVFDKVIIFGENLLFNRIGDYASGQYSENLKNLLARVRNVWMRDPFSALRVGHLTGDYENTCIGMDCSVLLRNGDLEVLKRNHSQGKELGKGKIGVFFHRNSKNLAKQFRFARKLALSVGLKAQWLPWRMDQRIGSKKRWSFPSLETVFSETGPSEGDLFDLLANYEFVITDTYHVCVNAWRLGTPAICIGEYLTENEWDVSCGPAHAWRDKRWIFYSMIEALDYYVHAHELTSSKQSGKRVGQLVAALNKKDNIRLITHFIHSQRNHLEMQLAEAITRIFRNTPGQHSFSHLPESGKRCVQSD